MTQKQWHRSTSSILHNVFPVTPTEPPTYDEATQKVEEVDPTFDGSIWSQAWQIVQLTPEEQEHKTEAKAYEVRQERDKRLEQCDWTQLPDTPDDPAGMDSHLRDKTYAMCHNKVVPLERNLACSAFELNLFLL